jgi:hypothetical protein
MDRQALEAGAADPQSAAAVTLGVPATAVVVSTTVMLLLAAAASVVAPTTVGMLLTVTGGSVWLFSCTFEL